MKYPAVTAPMIIECVIAATVNDVWFIARPVVTEAAVDWPVVHDFIGST
jgi:hypothetical protein